MTIIIPEIHAALQGKSGQPPTKLGLTSSTAPSDFIQPLHESTRLKSELKNTNSSISLVISKTRNSIENDGGITGELTSKNSSLPLGGSGVKVVSRGRRRSVDKQYRPSQPTGNNGGGGRSSSRRSGRSYQNYDNNSSNGNSGADGNGEDNDDSDDDDDDEYIDEDDDEEEEEDEEEEDEEEDKNEEDEENENRQEKNNGVENSIDENMLASFGLKVPGESSVVLGNAQTNENSLAQVPPGTPVTLQGIICQETIGGVLVVNIKWRNKIYCGSLMDCSRHTWARPRFQSVDGSAQGKTRLGKNNGRGQGKGKGKRLRSNSVTSTNSNNHTVSPLKQKLRGRKKTISGSSVERRQGFRSSKRKPKNDDDSDDVSRPNKRNSAGKGAPSPQPSPTLIECPEPGCEKKYKHINGLRYHQAHAHLESKNQEDDNNSDDRSSTTPSPGEDFKQPDPLTTAKTRVSNIATRSASESVEAVASSEKEPAITDDMTKKPETEKDKDQEENSENESKQGEEMPDKCMEEKEENTALEKPKEDSSQDSQTVNNDGEYVEVADKSTDTITTTSYTCTKHTPVAMDTLVPDNELPEVADTQEVWETVLDSGCVSSSVITGAARQDNEKETSEKDLEGQQVLITTSINQLGIEVEDISENEDDIDPGQDVEFNSRQEMEKAVENLQSGSFVTSLSTEQHLHVLSSLKDPSLMYGLTNREKIHEDKEGSEDSQGAEAMTTLQANTDITASTLCDSKAQSNTKSVLMELPVTGSMSVETLVSRSISASKHEPPLTNADTPSSRFKYFPCRSYGDETYAETASNITTNTTTTLALIRDPELIKTDTCTTPSSKTIVNTKALDSPFESTGPSYTGALGFNQDCTTSSIHSYGPKEELKEQSSSGDIVLSYGTETALTSDRHGSNPSFSSPKSSTSTTFHTKLQSSHIETVSLKKEPNSSILEKDNNVEEEKKDDDKKHLIETTGEDEDKPCVLFVRQPSAIVAKQNRPPVGVAHPYQHSSGTTTTLTTSESEPNKTDEIEGRVQHKYPIPVGEVGPVNVKRPAIHAGLPTVIPVGAPSLKAGGQGALPFRQGLKASALQEDRSLTPGSLRMASSPRSIPSSPRPFSTSPKLSPKTSVSETKTSPPKPIASQSSSSSSSSKPSDSADDTDVVIVKEKEPKALVGDTDRKTYEAPTEHITPEQIHLYQFQRQMLQLAQAGMDPLLRYTHLRSFGYDIPSLPYPWHLNMSPEQMKMMQQQRLRAEEERVELHASKSSKEESNKVKLDKRDSTGLHEGRSVQEATAARRTDTTSTPPRLERLERQRLMSDLSPGEAPRSVTGEAGSRGMPCLEPPEKKPKVEMTSKDEGSDRELQNLRHKREVEYLSKQSMQHKFAMFKRLESAGGAGKTHSIPALIDGSKRDEDYQKAKYSPHSANSDLSNQTLEKNRKYPVTTDPDDVRQSSSPRSRDPKAKHTRMPERSPFVPTQFQEYLQHSQMLDQINYDPSTGKPVSLISGQLGLDSVSYASSRIRDSSSPYKSPSPRPSRPHSPTKDHPSPVPSSRAPPHRPSEASRSPYKTDRPSASQSTGSTIRSSTARTSYRPTSPSTSYGSDSGHMYRVPTSSPSRGTIFSRADKPRSPLHHTDPRSNPRSEGYLKESSSTTTTSRAMGKDTSPKTSAHQEDAICSKHGGGVYRSQERQKEVEARPGIISNNLAVRRGDVTTSMLMPGHAPPDEDLLRRHSYLMYSPYAGRMMEHRQPQHDQVYAAMMPSAQKSNSRTDQYYGKRQ